MKIPIGDWLRAWKGCPGWLRKLLGITQGTVVHVPGGQDVVLTERAGAPFPRGQSPLDSIPSKPGGSGGLLR